MAWRTYCCCCSFWTLLICGSHLMKLAEGQGYLRSGTSTVLGVSSSYKQLEQQYSSSKAWRKNFRKNPAAACSQRSGASLCAAADTQNLDSYVQLLLATSPQVYSSTNAAQVGPVRLVAAAQNQLDCQSCTAFAVTAAAETAMAAALGVPVEDCSMSVQALFFCPPGRPVRSCEAGWTLPDALQQLEQRSSSIPTADCLPYRPDIRGTMSRKTLCEGGCSNVNIYADKGSFSSIAITSVWRAQQHIRQHGAVVTRFDVFSDFRPFFEKGGNAQAVYRPAPNAKLLFGHAVVLVGYNNEHQPPYWIAKNSYGPKWGDNGLFKVAFDTCSVLTAGTGEAYGLVWTPKPDQPKPAALRMTVVPVGPSRPDCFWYKAQPRDYMSRVAWLAGITLEAIMLDNTVTVKDLDAPLAGIRLLLCGPSPSVPMAISGNHAANVDKKAVKCADQPGIYWMEGALKRHFPNWDNYVGWGAPKPTTVPCGALAAIPEGPAMPDVTNRAVSCVDQPGIYWMEGGLKHHFPNWDNFVGWGAPKPTTVLCGALGAVPEGFAMPDVDKRAVKCVDQPGIYWMEGGLKRHFPDWDNYVGWGAPKPTTVLCGALAAIPEGPAMPTATRPP